MPEHELITVVFYVCLFFYCLFLYHDAVTFCLEIKLFIIVWKRISRYDHRMSSSVATRRKTGRQRNKEPDRYGLIINKNTGSLDHTGWLETDQANNWWSTTVKTLLADMSTFYNKRHLNEGNVVFASSRIYFTFQITSYATSLTILVVWNLWMRRILSKLCLPYSVRIISK